MNALLYIIGFQNIGKKEKSNDKGIETTFIKFCTGDYVLIETDKFINI